MMNRLIPTAEASRESFNGRKKVTLAPGHSLMDWIRLGRTQGDLSGVGSNKTTVTPSQLARHNTQGDIWMAIRGKVYNMTPYLDFHPGGVDELMRAAGKDGTQLFDEIHNWVNAESMLEKCLIGKFDLTDMKYLMTLMKNQNILGYIYIYVMYSVHLQKMLIIHTSQVVFPVFYWYQNTADVVVVIYSKMPDMRREFVIVDCSEKELLIQVLIKEFSYFVHVGKSWWKLACGLVMITNKGKVEVFFAKQEQNANWSSLGSPLKLNQQFIRNKNIECRYRQWTVLSNTQVTHNTRLICVQPPAGCRIMTPVGYHVHIKAKISGMEIGRNYTVITPSLTKPFSDPNNVYLMVKQYTGGALSPWICSLKQGDKMLMSNFDGDFDLSRLEQTTYLAMFAAGTGFTSMVRLIVHSLFMLPNANFPVKLMFYNKSQKDMLWHDQLKALEEMFPSRFSVTHCLSHESDPGWRGLKGRVSDEQVKNCVDQMGKTKKPLFCICGPWAYNDMVETLAVLHGLDEKNIYVFTQRI
ncbi:unnamed protein product [Lymnaea stagnalis]|uniref:Cytochrome b5 reductase 4 n=1 Tax=Lymnaea stagnalis TaxID=6523 RepID=A0AAV2HFK0_LYMST